MKKRTWEKVMAIGCNHGNHANPKALEAVLEFAKRWKPKHRIHLGDNYDTACFRGGAKGTSDESAPIGPDIEAGQRFINAFKPTVFCMGNHEHRLVRLSQSPTEMVRIAANRVLDDCLQPIKRLKATLIPYTIHPQGWYRLGGFSWGHGHIYSENYLRDTAETWGNTVVAHAHRPGIARGRRSDGAICYGVGTLSDIPNMDYANNRRSTMAWGHGMVFGEVCEDQAQLCLWEWPCNTTEFRLPL